VSELPEGWAEVPISQLCSVNPRHDSSEDRQQEISFVPMLAVSDTNGRIESHETKVLNDVWKGYTHFQEGDVIFAKITPCMENGKIAVARGLHGGIACGSTEFHVLRPFSGFNVTYLWYFLRQKKFRIEAERHMTGAVGQRRVPKAYLESYLMPLPPANEQRRIVAKLDSLFERTRRAREELSQIPRLIEHYKKAILEAAFRGDLTKDWREQRGLPDPKDVGLSDVAESFSYGSSAKSSPTGRIPVLRMGNIQDMALDWSDLAYTSDEQEIEKYALTSGDVLFNRTNSPELVGKTAIYRAEQPAIYAGYLIRIKCGSRLLPQYLNYCLNSPVGRQYCWSVKSDGVSQSNINAKKLAAFSFLLPSLEEQVEIICRIEKTLNWLKTIAAEQSQATRLLDHLDQANLAKAFRGELVPQDPNDEPACALLERIRAAQPKPIRRRRARSTTAVERD